MSTPTPPPYPSQPGGNQNYYQGPPPQQFPGQPPQFQGPPPQFPGQPPQFQGAPGPVPGKPKKPIFKKWWFWVLVVIALGMISSAMNGGKSATSATVASQAPAAQTSTSQPANTQAPAATQAPATTKAPETTKASSVAKMGTPVQAGDLAITVNSASPTTQLKSVFGTKKGNWIVVDVTIKNNGKDQVMLNASQFKLLEPDGTEYGTDSDNIMYIDSEKNLFLKDLNPKLSLQGQALFAVPTSVAVKDLTLEFSGGLFGPWTKISLTK